LVIQIYDATLYLFWNFLGSATSLLSFISRLTSEGEEDVVGALYNIKARKLNTRASALTTANSTTTLTATPILSYIQQDPLVSPSVSLCQTLQLTSNIAPNMIGPGIHPTVS